jgi:uncharacterized protein YdaU (DUF1376 family)
LRHIYTTGQGIPDKHRLSIAKATLPEYEQSVAFVLDSFFVRIGGEWVNERAKEVMKAQDEKHQKLVIAGKKGGKAGLSHPKASLKPPPKQPEPEPNIRNKVTTLPLKEKRGSRISENFDPDGSCWELSGKLNLTSQDCQDALSNFVDYWRGIPGAKGLKLDWQATFRNQLRHISKTKGRSNVKTSKPEFIHPATIAGEKLRAQLGIKTDGGEVGHDSHDWIEGDYIRE